jgi:hypothetical protein
MCLHQTNYLTFLDIIEQAIRRGNHRVTHPHRERLLRR